MPLEPEYSGEITFEDSVTERTYLSCLGSTNIILFSLPHLLPHLLRFLSFELIRYLPLHSRFL